MSVVLPVAKRGEDILKLIAAPVSANELNSNWLYQLADAMHATMLERNGVGLLHRKFISLNALLLWLLDQIHAIRMRLK